MIELLSQEWKVLLKEELLKDYIAELEGFVEGEYQLYPNETFPKRDEIFKAFNKVLPHEVKVVIVGQDPYPTRGHANGLCFSLNPTVQPLAKSLVNIFRELQNDVGVQFPQNGDLTPWADQGVLLINAVLTVHEGKPQSHQKKGWEKFTDAVIQELSSNYSNIVFLLWGAYAIKKGKKIDVSKHFILESGHPSPLSANQGKWFGNRHFSKTNELLKSVGKTEINWQLDFSYDLFNSFIDPT